MTDEQINKYIINNFNKKFEKYGSVIEITTKNHISIILLYSIMIIEDFNHSFIKRSLENIKLFFGKQAPVGIMQVRSKTRLSDEESIRRAYDIIKKKVYDEASLVYEDTEVYVVAREYNPSDDYAKSVGFIFKTLYNYVIMSSLYTEKFLFHNYAITSDNNNELESDTLNSAQIDESQIDNYELSAIKNICINNENIQKKGFIRNTLILKKCKNIVLENLGNFETFQSVAIKLIDCKRITIKNSEIGNCTYGIVVENSDVNIINCKIYNCSYGAMLLQNTIANVNNIKICKCKNTVNGIVTIESSELSLKKVKIVDCSASESVIKTINSTIKQADIEIKNEMKQL